MLDSIMKEIERLKQELNELYHKFDENDHSHYKQYEVSQSIKDKTEQLASLKQSLAKFSDGKTKEA